MFIHDDRPTWDYCKMTCKIQIRLNCCNGLSSSIFVNVNKARFRDRFRDRFSSLGTGIGSWCVCVGGFFRKSELIAIFF